MSIYSFPDAGNVRPRAFSGNQNGLPLSFENGVPVLPTPTVGSLVRDAVKRAIDVTIAASALVALSPLLAGLAVATRLSSPGPAIFSQWRTGRHGRKFRIYKFRTMRIEASDETGVRQVCPNDPGLTRLGAFMRARSLDELPQLFNVLRGDMSLVGPRPHAIGMHAAGMPYEALVPYYHLRHAVRPGLSGWAQANGLRGPTTEIGPARSRIEHDLAYIQNQSTWLDIRIIALTLKREFLTGSGL